MNIPTECRQWTTIRGRRVLPAAYGTLFLEEMKPKPKSVSQKKHRPVDWEIGPEAIHYCLKATPLREREAERRSPRLEESYDQVA
jgi:hypothetical protein